MKKTLIALAVAASAVVSGSAMAWTNGNFNGSVDIGGSVTVGDNFAQKWAWQTGTSLGAFDGNSKEMTDSGKKLVITAAQNAAILLGKTNEAFMATDVASSAIPQIAFSDYQKGKVTPVFADAANTGTGYLEIPVVDTQSSPIGQAKVNMTVAGVRMVSDVAQQRGVLGSVYADNSNDIFFGGVPAVADGVMNHGNAAVNFVQSMGGLSSADLLGQLTAVESTIVNTAASTFPQKSSMTENVTAATYAMGIKSGQTLELTFTKPVTQTTAWKAPLNVSVTYQ
ncbi:TPA: fimbrial protein [Escherichia coli]|nr:fimbrial protein [Escherichia coli]HBA7580010.1 fimbrial protein [Escherichia coli]HBB0108969.1 fimbrial protein [Escherichia coli]